MKPRTVTKLRTLEQLRHRYVASFKPVKISKLKTINKNSHLNLTCLFKNKGEVQVNIALLDPLMIPADPSLGLRQPTA